MMMQPRVYIHVPSKRPQSPDFSEKGSVRSSIRSTSRSKSPSSFPIFRSRESSPTGVPSRSTSPLARKVTHEPPQDFPRTQKPKPQPIQDVPRFRRDSAKSLLSATAIPIRKKPRGRLSQRLPRGDYVADFSRLMMDDVKQNSTVSLSRSLSCSNFDGLFGHMDELLEDDQMYVGSEGLDMGVLSVRSASEESLSSMPSPDDFTFSDDNSQHSSTSQLVDRKGRQFAPSEDCTDDHPLSLPTDSEDYFGSTPDQSCSTPVPRKPISRRDNKFRPSFKSSLTASLKALRSAAQSVAPRSFSSSQPNSTNDVVARSFFDIQPALTDDRRPPPSLESPTPELRRYLNPPPLDSAAQLHFWQDHRHSSLNPPKDASRKRAPKVKRNSSPKKIGTAKDWTKDLPQVVPLADCLPPSVRTANASSPPIWLSPDGTPINKSTANHLLYDPDSKDGKANIGIRHREPRENRDFLRVFVCEMQMRRNGKLSDDISAGRARLWLPPVDENVKPSTQEMPKLDQPTTVVKKQKQNARDRLMCLTIEDL